MAITETIGYQGQVRKIELSGDSVSEFELYVKQGSNYYNWDTDSFQVTEKVLKSQKIPSSGTYTKSINIPSVTSNTSYDFYVRAISGSTLDVSTTNDQKIGVLYQKGTKTMTFTATESSALVVQNSGSAGTDLTGGTLDNNLTTLTQTGTITEASGLFVYIHETPSWNINDGGSWTNANIVTTTIVSMNGNKIVVKDGSNISSGYAVTGKGIIDEITVSAISGNIVTLSTAQNLTQGQELIFSAARWEIETMTASFTAGASGTVTITMATVHKINTVGIADVTSVLNVDAFASVKPNAFPVTVECPAGGTVVIQPIRQSTNYLGKDTGDIDSNISSKTYKVHSVPTDGTSSRPTGILDSNGDMTYAVLSVYGASSVSAGAAMGSAGAASVTYTPHADMIAGDKDFFYYKTVDAQSTPVTSSTTQGKISITIV